MRWTRYEIPDWGVGEIGVCEGRLVEHSLPRRGVEAQGDEDALAERFSAYFAGARDDFCDVELHPFDRTRFEQDVLDAARRIPYGEVVSYGELAALAGHPGAQRAAGSFCARNPYGLVVPCHRIVGADGPGSYGSLGLEYKLRLLRLEGVPL